MLEQPYIYIYIYIYIFPHSILLVNKTEDMIGENWLREESFLMPGTRAKGIFEELKKFLSHGSIWQKVLPQHDLLKRTLP